METLKKIWSWLWGKFSFNTHVRHVVISLAAVTIALFATPLTDWLVTLPVISNSAQAVALVAAVSAYALRWAQTHLELLIGKLKSNPPNPAPPVVPPSP